MAAEVRKAFRYLFGSDVKTNVYYLFSFQRVNPNFVTLLICNEKSYLKTFFFYFFVHYFIYSVFFDLLHINIDIFLLFYYYFAIAIIVEVVIMDRN